MFAHVVTFDVSPEQFRSIGMQGFEERVVPVLKSLAGFQRALIMLDLTQNQHLGISLWDTEEHARAAGERLERERQTGVGQMQAAASTAAIYEVLAQV